MQELLSRMSYFAVYDRSILDALDFALTNGFTGVQIAAELPHLSLDATSISEVRDIRRMLNDHGMRLIFHAHDTAAPLTECNLHLRGGTLEYYRALFASAQRVGATIITLHLGSFTAYPTHSKPVANIPKNDMPVFAAALRTNLQRLIAIAAGRFVLCVENDKLDDLTCRVLQEFLDKGAVSLCWDIPKMYDRSLRPNAQLERYFWRNVRHVRQVHLHDLDRQGRSHRVIGSGDIDFIRYLTKLRRHNVLDFCIDVRPRVMAKRSLDNLRHLLQRSSG